MVKDIYSGSGGSSPDYLTTVGNTLYFTAYESNTNGDEMWSAELTSDGSDAKVHHEINYS
jgi:hypothetical protein